MAAAQHEEVAMTPTYLRLGAVAVAALLAIGPARAQDDAANARLDALQKQIAEKLGFRLVDHRMELYGVSLSRKD